MALSMSAWAKEMGAKVVRAFSRSLGSSGAVNAGPPKAKPPVTFVSTIAPAGSSGTPTGASIFPRMGPYSVTISSMPAPIPEISKYPSIRA